MKKTLLLALFAICATAVSMAQSEKNSDLQTVEFLKPAILWKKDVNAVVNDLHKQGYNLIDENFLVNTVADMAINNNRIYKGGYYSGENGLVSKGDKMSYDSTYVFEGVGKDSTYLGAKSKAVRNAFELSLLGDYYINKYGIKNKCGESQSYKCGLSFSMSVALIDTCEYGNVQRNKSRFLAKYEYEGDGESENGCKFSCDGVGYIKDIVEIGSAYKKFDDGQYEVYVWIACTLTGIRDNYYSEKK